MRVQVIFAERECERCTSVELDEGMTIADAIERAWRTAEFAGLNVAGMRVGIFGKPARPDTGLRDGDRVEIYRPLEVDPQQARRRRALKKGKAAAL